MLSCSQNTPWYRRVWNSIKNGARKVWNVIKGVFGFLKNTIKAVVCGLANAVQNTGNLVYSIIRIIDRATEKFARVMNIATTVVGTAAFISSICVIQ